jgi:arylsulfatase A-like enzyme
VDHRDILGKEPGYPYNDLERATLKDYYRQESEYADAQVGVLFDALKQRGRLDPGMFVVTADHGESLGEHGINFTHHGIYEEVVRVPLVVWTRPAQAMSSDPTSGFRVAAQVNVSDIANTLLEFARLPLLSGTNSTPLLSHARGMDVGRQGIVLVGREGASLTDGQLCGFRDVRRDGALGPYQGTYLRHQDGREEAYDILSDPGQLADIATAQPQLVEGGRANVSSCTGSAAVAGAPPPQTDRAECERLKALGYVTGDCN